MKVERIRKNPDFSIDEFLYFIEDYINGAYYPKSAIEISRISSISSDVTGFNGELVSITPFFFKYTLPFFIPDGSDSSVSSQRLSVKSQPSDIYGFSLSPDMSDQGFSAHNALVMLNKISAAGYAVPLFYNRRDMSLLSRAKVVSPWKYDEESIFTRKNKNEKQIVSKIPLLKECAFIYPHSTIEEKSEKFYYSYDSSGDVCFHGHETVKIKKNDDFILNIFFEKLLTSSQKEVTLQQYSEVIFELLPELFSLKWTSRKMKFIVEHEIYKLIDEQNVPQNMSFNHLLDELTSFEKVIIFENILSYYFGVSQYFKFRIRK
ncbi:MAG: hypothetical protein JW982_14240 [Spirochaetes bacterium]|nr:hypothetical protein [Spirochaetota bacterium]